MCCSVAADGQTITSPTSAGTSLATGTSSPKGSRELYKWLLDDLPWSRLAVWLTVVWGAYQLKDFFGVHPISALLSCHIARQMRPDYHALTLKQMGTSFAGDYLSCCQLASDLLHRSPVGSAAASWSSHKDISRTCPLKQSLCFACCLGRGALAGIPLQAGFADVLAPGCRSSWGPSS